LRAFYSIHDTRTPFLLNCFENALNIVLAIALYPWLGIPGLAIAFSAAYAATAPLTLGVLSRKIGGLQGRGIGTSSMRVLVAAVGGGLTAWVIGRGIGSSTSLAAIASTVAGGLGAAVVIVLAMTLLRVEEFAELRSLVVRRRRGGPPPAPEAAPARWRQSADWLD
jgi:putative peptidoglycan lipid II flippase